MYFLTQKENQEQNRKIDETPEEEEDAQDAKGKVQVVYYVMRRWDRIKVHVGVHSDFASLLIYILFGNLSTHYNEKRPKSSSQ